MPKFMTVADNNYSRGMNTVEASNALQDGECLELVNAIPGYPLVVRNGCAVKKLYRSGQPVGGAVTGNPYYAHFIGREYLFFWKRDDNNYGLYAILLGGDAEHEPFPVQAATMGGGFEPLNVNSSAALDFDFVIVRNVVYTSVSSGSLKYAIEWDDAQNALVARRIPLADTTAYPRMEDGSVYFENDVSAYAAGENRPFFKGNFVLGYSMTFVRRPKAENEDENEIQYAYVPGSIESCEVPATRRGVVRTGAGTNAGAKIFIKPAVDGFGNIAEFRYTHVRVYRTQNLYYSAATADENQENIKGSTRYFLMDVPIFLFYSNGMAHEVEDTVTIDTLSGEMNQLSSFKYSFPPSDSYKMFYFKNRLFLAGQKGTVYFSEIPGGDGGTDLEHVLLNSDKYALWFKPLHYRVDLNVEEQSPVTGMRALGDDLFLFKEDNVYMIVKGDPLSATPRKINDMFGCPFPDTITNVIIGGEESLFYLSGAGPVIIQRGGNHMPFTDFKVRGLWAHTSGELLRLPRADVEWCRAAFWNDTVWVFYKHQGRVARIYGYLSRDNASGAFSVSTGGSAAKRYTPRGIAITDTNKAVTVCANGGGDNLLVDFMGSGGYDDELDDEGGARVSFRLYSRKLFPGPKPRNMSELFRAVSNCNFSGEAEQQDVFSLVVFNNRYTAEFDYLRNGREGPHYWENNMPQLIENLRQNITFTLPADFVGEYFQYTVEKTVPPDGRFEWYGLEMDSLPRPQLDTEDFMPSTRTSTSGVFVTEADILATAIEHGSVVEPAMKPNVYVADCGIFTASGTGEGIVINPCFSDNVFVVEGEAFVGGFVIEGIVINPCFSDNVFVAERSIAAAAAEHGIVIEASAAANVYETEGGIFAGALLEHGCVIEPA